MTESEQIEALRREIAQMRGVLVRTETHGLVDGLVAERDRYKAALEQIVAMAEDWGDDYSNIAPIARAALAAPEAVTD